MGTSKRQQPKHLPKKLRLIRLSTGYTQKQLSGFLDEYNLIRQSNISYYESGKRPVPLWIAVAYVDFANLHTSFTITFDDLVDESKTILEVFK